MFCIKTNVCVRIALRLVSPEHRCYSIGTGKHYLPDVFLVFQLKKVIQKSNEREDTNDVR